MNKSATQAMSAVDTAQIRDIERALSDNPDLQTGLGTVLRSAAGHLGTSTAAALSYDAAPGTFVRLQSVGFDERFYQHSPASAQAVSQSVPVFLTSEAGSVCASPMAAQDGAIIGLLEFYFPTPRSLTPREKSLVEIYTLLAGFCLENSGLHAQNRTLRSLLDSSNNAVQQFIRVGAHDIRSPMVTMSNMVQLMMLRYQGKLDQKFDETLALCQAEVERFETLNRDLTAYAMLGTESADSPARVPLDAALTVALDQLNEMIRQTRAEVVSSDLPHVLARKEHVIVLFSQLISNALKFADGSPRIRVAADVRPEQCVVTVQDNGPGIPPPYTETIFEPFKRLHGKKYPGSGLGLAMCKKITRFYGGEIWVESTPDEGSTFLFSLPLSPGSDASAAVL